MTFIELLTRIRTLVLTQRGVRLTLRAIWLALAGYLVGWGIYTLWGVLENSYYWSIIGLVFAAPVLFALFRPIGLGKLSWGMDRHFDSKEQITTAWRVSDREETPNQIEALLIGDAAEILPGSLARILQRGWFLLRDAESLLIVLTILGAIFFFTQENLAIEIPPYESEEVPSLSQPPSASDVFPDGIPGQAGSAGGEGGPGSGGEGEMSAEAMGQLDNILTDLGEQLSENPETADIGEALQNGDLKAAAAAIERTADNVDLLPPEARQNAQQAFQQAAQEAAAAGQQDLADSLQAAASALQNPDPNNPMAADALDDLAAELRELGEAFASMGQPGGEDSNQSGPQVGSSDGASGAGSGSGTEGEGDPLTRLEGEGADLEFEGGTDPSDLLTPGDPGGNPPAATGNPPTIAGSTAPGESGSNTSILTPYHYSWRWRDLISQYFSPEK